jgi:dihydroorotase
VNLIRDAKKAGQSVTCDVSIFNLCLTDKVSEQFDSNLKLMPLLRTEKDRKALIKGLKDGTIDAICSNHCPQNVELKKVEFDYADFGALSHQTFLSMAIGIQDELPLELLVDKLTNGPAEVLNQGKAGLEEGIEANLTLFDASEEWMYNNQSNRSLSNNSHLFNSRLKGKIKAVCRNKKVNLY